MINTLAVLVGVMQDFAMHDERLLKANWAEMRTAYFVGRFETISTAALELGVHRATVIRHIDSLESALKEKLFHRHGKGYPPTETGQELMHVAQSIELRLTEFVLRSRADAEELTGELHFTTREVTNALILPLLAAFQQQHPTLAVRYSPTPGRLRLDYGEAHIALRIGDKVENEQHISRHFADIEFGLFATKAYAQRRGIPHTIEEASAHQFVCFTPKEPSLPLHTFIQSIVPEEQVVFRSDSPLALDAALDLHMGIGFVPLHFANKRHDLIPVWQPWPNWSAPVWFVIHESIFHSYKIQSFLEFAKRRQASRRTEQYAGK
ncbi:MAG: LysR family transcriptional regulator [Pseudomonadota bacterium]